MKVGFVTGLSFLLTSIVVGNAFYHKKQFYPTVVYITKSNPSLAVLALQALVVVLFTGKLMRKLFFGQLRPAEVEHLIEKSWYAITETCLAFTVFREDFSVTFVAMFTVLLFLKCFHWLAEDRVDYMERSPALGCLFHVRILALLTLLVVADGYFVQHAYLSTVTKGATAQLVFGFEYAILVIIVFMTFCKYTLHALDMRHETPWEGKAVLLLHLELITNFAKLMLYLTFVAIMVKVHTFPLFAVRPLYLTLRAFKKAASDVVLSRRAIRNMNTLYPDATPEELHGGDVCIICREEMVAATGGCKKLPCSHIFHASCLRSWFQRQQTCPTCRLEVLRTRPAAAAAAAAAPQQQRQYPAAAAAAAVPLPPQFPLHPDWQAMFAGMHQRWPAAPPAAPGPSAAPAPPSGPPAGGPPAGGSAFQQQAAGVPLAPQQVLFGTSTPSWPGLGLPTLSASSPTWPNLLPPPYFMPFGFSLPPPMPPPPSSLRAMTLEELRALEGSERTAVEARVRWLRDIQTLLDAAVEQMAQYVAVTSALSSASPSMDMVTRPQPASGGLPSATASGTPAPAGLVDADTTPGASNMHSASNDSSDCAAAVQASLAEPNAAAVSGGDEGGAAGDLSLAEEAIPHWADPREEEFKDEMHEVRRRRLQRLQPDGTAESSST